MRVVIVGAGLSGLALATGLARDGHRVDVLESDASLTARDPGYRLHLDWRGLDALRSLLPAPAWGLVEATRGQFAEPRELTVLSSRLRPLRTVAIGPGVIDGRVVSTAVDRGTLRSVLAGAATLAGARVRWGAPFDAAHGEGAQVRVTAGGIELMADLLVGADGARSRVVALVAPAARAIDSGAGAIVGRSPLGAVSERLMERLDHGYVVLHSRRAGVGLGLLRLLARPDRAAADAAIGIELPAVEDYVGWNVGLTDRRPLADASPEQAHQEAVRRVRRWHPDVRRLVGEADVRRIFVAPVLQAQRPEPWSPGRITVIGDAAHAMPPDRGSGANLALADAARLAEALAQWGGVTADGSPPDEAEVLAAVGRYEREMIERAFAISEAGPTVSRATSGSG